jgi:hypothetical protein
MAEVVYQVRSFRSQFRNDVSQSLESRHRGIVPDYFRARVVEKKEENGEVPNQGALWDSVTSERFRATQSGVSFFP